MNKECIHYPTMLKKNGEGLCMATLDHMFCCITYVCMYVNTITCSMYIRMPCSYMYSYVICIICMYSQILELLGDFVMEVVYGKSQICPLVREGICGRHR